jgi:hypothetical protein
MHPHLKEIYDFLEDSDKKVDKHAKTLAKWLDNNHKYRLLVRHSDEFDEIVITLIDPQIEYRISCREFADERLSHFIDVCTRLKSWLQMREETKRSRSAASDQRTGS